MFKLVCYHHIVADDDPLLSMFHGPNIDGFVADLDYMQATGDVWPLSAVVEALRAGEAPEQTVWCVTFDDGLWSQSELAAPVLVDRGLSAAFFVSTRGSADDGLLDVHKLQMLFARLRMEQFPVDDPQAMIAEMVPAGVLDAALVRGSHDETVMCYPYGDFDDETVRLAREVGFTAGVSTVAAPARADDDVMAIPRFDAVDVAAERASVAEPLLSTVADPSEGRRR